MTQDQFIDLLGKLPPEYKPVLDSGEYIRIDANGFTCCPLTAVCWATEAAFFDTSNAEEAAKCMGADFDASQVIEAADTPLEELEDITTPGRKRFALRRAMLKALKLEEVT